MRYSTDLKTLALAAYVITLACAAATDPASAQTQAYYHVGVWDAFSGRNDKGGAVCGVGNTDPSNNRRMSFRFDIGGTATVFSVSKPDWSIPDNTRIAVVMQVGLNSPWTEAATGHGHYIDWSADGTAMQMFDQQFRGASSMTLTFPDGNEPPWTISLSGSSAISDAFGRCVRDLTRQVQALQPRPGQPPDGNAPAPPGVGPSATQPFSPAAGGPPSEAANAGVQPPGPQTPEAQSPEPQSPGPQPDAAPPAGPPSGETQPYGTQPR